MFPFNIKLLTTMKDDTVNYFWSVLLINLYHGSRKMNKYQHLVKNNIECIMALLDTCPNLTEHVGGASVI